MSNSKRTRKQVAFQAEVAEGFKRCTKCELSKSIEDFSPSKTGWRGVAARCRLCQAKIAVETRDAVAIRAYHLKTNYGLTVEEYDELLQKQGGVCAICSNPPKAQSLHVDHDPKCCPRTRGKQGTIKTCGKCIRGLVCYPCNGLLGKIENGYLDKFYSYLSLYRGDYGE